MKHQHATGLPRDLYEQNIQALPVSVITVTELKAKHPEIIGIAPGNVEIGGAALLALSR